MDAETQKLLAENPKIDKAASILIELLHRAVAEHQYGEIGVVVTVYDGGIRQTKEISEVTHN